MPRDKNIFTLNPTSLDMKRSVFPRNCQHKTSFNLGEICPVYMAEILPGDTVTMDMAEVIRTSSPFIAPVMDNIHADVYFMFVPLRLVWQNWEQFNGANENGAWTNTTAHNFPQQDIGLTHFPCSVGSIGDHLGLPVNDNVVQSNFRGLPNALKVSELPLRAYYKIYNDWFRDENSIAPVIYTIGDGSNSNILYRDSLKKASRFHDLFSSCLPGPQKGASVVLPLGTSAPVYAGDSKVSMGALYSGGVRTMQFAVGDKTTSDGGTFSFASGVGTVSTTGTDSYSLEPLIADLSSATASTINALRTAFQVQKLLEKDARGGTRYIELLRAHFGVTSPDARLQRSEYIAGMRFRINVDQVVATADSGSTGSSVVGEPGAISKTVQGSSMFTKSFVEHGLLMGFVVLRQDHTYSQGLDKYWLKKDRFDFYYPVLANIGEVPVYKSEINCRVGSSGSVGEGSGVFGYQEAWYDYRYSPSRATGYMNPIVSNALSQWTLGDAFGSVPGLNQTFLEETPTFLDRALTVSSSVMHQFIADFYFKAKFSRVMPLYSVPGLIDHH